jgi:hypothetical protein
MKEYEGELGADFIVLSTVDRVTGELRPVEVVRLPGFKNGPVINVAGNAQHRAVLDAGITAEAQVLGATDGRFKTAEEARAIAEKLGLSVKDVS